MATVDTDVWSVTLLPDAGDEEAVDLDEFRSRWLVKGFPDPRVNIPSVLVEVEELDLAGMSAADRDPRDLLVQADHLLVPGLDELEANLDAFGALDRLFMFHTVWVDPSSSWQPTEVQVVGSVATTLCARKGRAWDGTGLVCGLGALQSDSIARLGFLQISDAVWFVRLSRGSFWKVVEHENEEVRRRATEPADSSPMTSPMSVTTPTELWDHRHTAELERSRLEKAFGALAENLRGRAASMRRLGIDVAAEENDLAAEAVEAVLAGGPAVEHRDRPEGVVCRCGMPMTQESLDGEMYWSCGHCDATGRCRSCGEHLELEELVEVGKYQVGLQHIACPGSAAARRIVELAETSDLWRENAVKAYDANVALGEELQRLRRAAQAAGPEDGSEPGTDD